MNLPWGGNHKSLPNSSLNVSDHQISFRLKGYKATSFVFDCKVTVCFSFTLSLSIMVFYLSIIIYISIYISVSFLFKFKCVLANIVWKDDVYFAALYLFHWLRFIISLISFVSFKINYISYFIHNIPYIRLSLPLPLSWQIVMNH